MEGIDSVHKRVRKNDVMRMLQGLVLAGCPDLRCAPAGSRRGGSRLPIGGRNHFLTLKCRKSGGGWFFLIGIKLPSAPSIYRSLPMNTSLRSSVQLFSVHITVGKRV